MSYGTPESMDRIEAYYTHIRRGRPPAKEQLDDLIRRYEAIGGLFPLRRMTDAQTEELQKALDAAHPEAGYRCYQGLKHAEPFIEDGVRAMAEDGIRRAVGIVLAPHYSVMSVGEYVKRAQAAAREAGVEMAFVESYHDHPLLIEALSVRVEKALRGFRPVPPEDVRVMFTAHSLPERILAMNDPYPEQLLETSRLIAERAGLSGWQFAWQSAGATREPWLGPDVVDALKAARQEGASRVLICPIGFVSDHLEILYDLDIEAQAVAAEIGLTLARTEMLNTDPLYISVLADCVHRKRAHAREEAQRP